MVPSTYALTNTFAHPFASPIPTWVLRCLKVVNKIQKGRCAIMKTKSFVHAVLYLRMAFWLFKSNPFFSSQQAVSITCKWRKYWERDKAIAYLNISSPLPRGSLIPRKVIWVRNTRRFLFLCVVLRTFTCSR